MSGPVVAPRLLTRAFMVATFAVASARLRSQPGGIAGSGRAAGAGRSANAKAVGTTSPANQRKACKKRFSMADLREPLVVRSEEKVHPPRMKLDPVRRVYLDCEQAAPRSTIMPALIPALLTASPLVLTADSIPKVDVERTCRPAATARVLPGRDSAACQRDEQGAATSSSTNGANIELRNADN